MTTPLVDARVRLPAGLCDLPAAEQPASQASGYADVFGTDRTRPRSVDELWADLDGAGIDLAVVHAEYEYGDPADAMNEAVAALVARAPDRLAGFGTVSLAGLKPLAAVQQADTVSRLGLLGINIQPGFFGISIDDRRLYPLYARAAEHGLAVAIHTGINYDRACPIEAERPILLDRVACDFPELTFVACHAGWPWVPEMVAVARRHPHVYLEFGAIAPKYIGMPGSGWEVAFRLMDNVLADQVLFATDWPVFSAEESLRQWRELNLKRTTLDRLLGANAARLLGRIDVTHDGTTTTDSASSLAGVASTV